MAAFLGPLLKAAPGILNAAEHASKAKAGLNIFKEGVCGRNQLIEALMHELKNNNIGFSDIIVKNINELINQKPIAQENYDVIKDYIKDYIQNMSLNYFNYDYYVRNKYVAELLKRNENLFFPSLKQAIKKYYLENGDENDKKAEKIIELFKEDLCSGNIVQQGGNGFSNIVNMAKQAEKQAEKFSEVKNQAEKISGKISEVKDQASNISEQIQHADIPPLPPHNANTLPPPPPSDNKNTSQTQSSALPISTSTLTPQQFDKIINMIKLFLHKNLTIKQANSTILHRAILPAIQESLETEDVRREISDLLKPLIKQYIENVFNEGLLKDNSDEINKQLLLIFLGSTCNYNNKVLENKDGSEFKHIQNIFIDKINKFVQIETHNNDETIKHLYEQIIIELGNPEIPRRIVPIPNSVSLNSNKPYEYDDDDNDTIPENGQTIPNGTEQPETTPKTITEQPETTPKTITEQPETTPKTITEQPETTPKTITEKPETSQTTPEKPENDTTIKPENEKIGGKKTRKYIKSRNIKKQKTRKHNPRKTRKTQLLKKIKKRKTRSIT
jgi:hypothetical protein